MHTCIVACILNHVYVNLVETKKKIKDVEMVSDNNININVCNYKI